MTTSTRLPGSPDLMAVEDVLRQHLGARSLRLAVVAMSRDDNPKAVVMAERWRTWSAPEGVDKRTADDIVSQQMDIMRSGLDIAMSRMTRPALTTVRLPKQKAGQIAVELLLAVLDDPDPDTIIGTRGTLHGELIVRDSTGVASDPARP